MLIFLIMLRLRLLWYVCIKYGDNVTITFYLTLKSVFLLGDFNINLLSYNEHNQTNEFLDFLASNSFIPLILQPTIITSHSNTLIDNIFSDLIDPDVI